MPDPDHPHPGSTPLTLPETMALPDSNGKMHRLAEYRGQPLVLNFWATWCEPCRREIPLLQALHQATRQRRADRRRRGGLPEGRAAATPWPRGITYPLLMGEKDGLAAVNAFGMDTVFPFTVFADAQGDIVAVKVGELHADEARLILEKVTAVDAGKLGLADARSGGVRRAAQPRHCARATALQGLRQRLAESRDLTQIYR